MAFSQILLGAPTAVSVPPLPNRYLHRVQRNSSYSYNSLHPTKSQVFISSNSSSSSSSLKHNSTARLKPGNTIPFSFPVKSHTTLCVVSTVAAATAFLFRLGGGGFGGFSGGVGGGGGGGNGGGSDGGGGFWSRIFSPRSALASEEEKASWDPHGFPANVPIILSKLSGLKRYKISDLLFFDRRRGMTMSGTEDPLLDIVSILPGGIYTKAQLQKELEMLATCGRFERIDLDAMTKPDGTIGITISFAESMWQSADSFRCINVGLMPELKQPEMDSDMTLKETKELFESIQREYVRRMERSRECLLPLPVHSEIVSMLRGQGRVSARLLQKIRDEVQKWYQDEGYACAGVVNFGNLTTKEVVCEVVEGDITKLVVQFHDELGNVCEGNTDLSLIRRELPPQVISS